MRSPTVARSPPCWLLHRLSRRPEPEPEPAAGVGAGGGGGGGGSWGGDDFGGGDFGGEEEDRPGWLAPFAWAGEQTVGLGIGFGEGVVGLGEGGLMLYRLSPTNTIIDNESWREEWIERGRRG